VDARGEASNSGREGHAPDLLPFAPVPASKLDLPRREDRHWRRAKPCDVVSSSCARIAKIRQLSILSTHDEIGNLVAVPVHQRGTGIVPLNVSRAHVANLLK